jgi:acetyltransferase-like isoleucine patch superfamily enzyme
MDSLTHPIDPTERHLQFKSILTSGHPTKIDLDEEPVILEDNVWIGAGTTILKGTCIGENSIIGAGSVVTKDIPPNSIAAGNPAKVIKHISQRSINSKRAGIPIATIAQ